MIHWIFFGYLDLTQHETLARGEGGHHVDRALPLFLRPDRRDVFPSIAMTPSAIPVIDATHAAKQL